MNALNQKIETTRNEVSTLSERLSILENRTKYLQNQLEEESTKRRQLETIQSKFSSINNNELSILKGKIDNVNQLMDDALSKFKIQIENNIKSKTAPLQNLLEQKNNIIIDSASNRFLSENPFTQKIFEDNIKSKLSSLESDLLSTIKDLKQELNTNSAKIDFIEKNNTNNNLLFKEQINNLNNQMLIFQNKFVLLDEFTNNSNENFSGMANDIIQQQELINNFTNKLNFEISKCQNDIKDNEKILKNEIESLNSTKENLYGSIEKINSTAIDEISKFSEHISKDLKNYQNELEKFEQHIVNEQKNFTKFIQDKLGDHEMDVSKNLEYSFYDMKEMKKNLGNMQNNFEDFKDKIYVCINEIEEFQNKNYQNILRIFIKNNLIPPNFNYNSCYINRGDISDILFLTNRKVEKTLNNGNRVNNVVFPEVDKKENDNNNVMKEQKEKEENNIENEEKENDKKDA